MRLAVLMLPFLFIACAKQEVQVEVKEVFIPVKCPLKLPLKPTYKNTIESAKELSSYYLEVENIAIFCVKGDYHKND